MQVIGSVIREQGVTFAIVQVDGNRVNSSIEAEKTIVACQRLFPLMPIVLMAVRTYDAPTYWGRHDLVNFMSHVDPGRVPWKRYTFH